MAFVSEFQLLGPAIPVKSQHSQELSKVWHPPVSFQPGFLRPFRHTPHQPPQGLNGSPYEKLLIRRKINARSSALSDVNSHSSSDEGNSESEYFFFVNDNEPATHREPFGIHKDKRNRNVDMETLKQHIDSDRNHVELLLKSGRTWVPFYGRAERADFWNSLYGDGTKETPFFVRIPVAQAYATRVRFFTRTPSDSSIGYVQSEQRIKEDGSDIPGQEEDRLWYCHRPVTHAAMQAALMYAGFGRVQDVVASGPAILTAQDYKDASLLAQAGSKIYRREAMQRDRVNGVLCNILGCNIKQYTIRARVNDETTNFQTDGSVVHPPLQPESMLLNTEYKLGGTEGYFQSLENYRAFYAGRLDRQILQSSVAPCFSLDQPGAFFRLNAWFFSSRIHSEPLTPAYNLMSLERYNPHQMQQLALAVHALKKEFPLLEEFHDDLISNGDRSLRSTFIDQDLPYILYKGLGAEDALLQQLTDIQRPLGLHPWQRLWAARLPTREPVAVKCAPNYGLQVHEAWAERGLAPKVYLCVKLPGGVYVILMDMLTKEEGWWNVGELPPAAQAAVLPAIRGALKEAHNIPLSNWKKGGALGDCRFQNTFVKLDIRSVSSVTARNVSAVNFVDFDWAGPAGRQLYPPLMSDNVKWPLGAATGKAITQKHDRDLLESEKP